MLLSYKAESYNSSRKDLLTKIQEFPDHTEKSPSRASDSRNPKPMSFNTKVGVKERFMQSFIYMLWMITKDGNLERQRKTFCVPLKYFAFGVLPLKTQDRNCSESVCLLWMSVHYSWLTRFVHALLDHSGPKTAFWHCNRSPLPWAVKFQRKGGSAIKFATKLQLNLNGIQIIKSPIPLWKYPSKKVGLEG